MSAFLYKDSSRGVSYVLSRAIIKNELALLQGEVDDSTLPSVSYDTDNLQLRTIFSKLNFVPRVITNNDIERLLSVNLDIEMVSFIFTLNKPHFKAVIYLLYEGLITYDEIREISKATLYTRNELLLRKFSFGEDPQIALFDNFTDSIFPSFFSSASTTTTFLSGENLQFFDIQSEMVPEEYYAIRNILKSKSKFNDSVKWLSQDGIAIGNSVRSKSLNSIDQGLWYFYNEGIFLSYPALAAAIAVAVAAIALTFGVASIVILPIAALIGWSLIDGMNKYRKGGIFGEPYVSYLEYLTAKSIFLTRRQINKTDVVNYIINGYIPEHSRLVAKNNVNTVSSSLVTNSIKSGASFAISDPDKKPVFLNLFHHLYFSINNTGNYNTIGNFNFQDYNTNESNVFRSAITSAGSTIFDLSYIDTGNTALTPLKNRLLKIFAERSILRSSQNYIVDMVMTSVDKNNKETKSQIIKNPSILTDINKLLTMDINITSNRKVIGLGLSNKKEYALEAIRLAMIKVDEESQLNALIKTNVAEYGSFSDAKIGLQEISDVIYDAILAQTNNPDDSAENKYNRHLSLEDNVLFRPILAELIVSYLAYLADPTKSQFEFQISESSNSFKIYKALNFLKHTFNSFSVFFRDVKKDEMFRELSLLLLLAETNMRRDKIMSILEDGVTEGELTDLFRLGEDYFGRRNLR
jgi:hypothetical protein